MRSLGRGTGRKRVTKPSGPYQQTGYIDTHFLITNWMSLPSAKKTDSNWALKSITLDQEGVTSHLVHMHLTNQGEKRYGINMGSWCLNWNSTR